MYYRQLPKTLKAIILVCQLPVCWRPGLTYLLCCLLPAKTHTWTSLLSCSPPALTSAWTPTRILLIACLDLCSDPDYSGVFCLHLLFCLLKVAMPLLKPWQGKPKGVNLTTHSSKVATRVTSLSLHGWCSGEDQAVT